MQLHLRDLGSGLVGAWRREFQGVAGVTVSEGDLFSTRDGPVGPRDPIDVRADAVVSPANSFGFMDGGVDQLFTYVLGPQVQERVQRAIADSFGGELPVGQALIVPTDRPELPFCISAPTMRAPRDVSDTPNAYLALRAALLAAIAHGGIRSILCPGLATGAGAMPHARCARQMRAAWDRVAGGRPFVPRTVVAAEADDAWLRG